MFRNRLIISGLVGTLTHKRVKGMKSLRVFGQSSPSIQVRVFAPGQRCRAGVPAERALELSALLLVSCTAAGECAESRRQHHSERGCLDRLPRFVCSDTAVLCCPLQFMILTSRSVRMCER